METPGALFIDLAIFAWLLFRQLTARPLGTGRLRLILGVLGLAELAQFGKHHSMTGGAVIFIAASLAAGALLGALRATTVRVWRGQERFMRQGTWLTAVLWLVSVGGHVGAAQLLSGSAAQADRVALLLYLAVTLGAQRLVLAARVRTPGPRP